MICNIKDDQLASFCCTSFAEQENRKERGLVVRKLATAIIGTPSIPPDPQFHNIISHSSSPQPRKSSSLNSVHPAEPPNRRIKAPHQPQTVPPITLQIQLPPPPYSSYSPSCSPSSSPLHSCCSSTPPSTVNHRAPNRSCCSYCSSRSGACSRHDGEKSCCGKWSGGSPVAFGDRHPGWAMAMRQSGQVAE